MAGTIRYKAVYRNPKDNPFVPRPMVHTCTLDIDESVPREQVEQWAREAQGDKMFVRLEIISSANAPRAWPERRRSVRWKKAS